jgi:UDP-N-acetylglucosamine 2-epimerase (non-hydrolysing)
MLIDLIAGARPNFMKIAPIIHAIKKAQTEGEVIDFRLIHTGQHYDKGMSDNFFNQLDIPEPHVNLRSGSGTQAEQTGSIMVGYEKLLVERRSSLCLVVGDVTSTMACAITAQKMCIKVAHVEAGIRSGDWTMPEEINRLLTDSITNYFFTTTDIAGKNLLENGVSGKYIFFVGNTMIDTLVKNRSRFVRPQIWDSLRLTVREYIVLTLHRPSNVDQLSTFSHLLQEILNNSQGLPIIFPVHPRTSKILKIILGKGILKGISKLHLVDPMGYLEFNYLVERSKCVITDSGGITEETTVMGVPCMTLRNNTERPETVTQGTNVLLGTNPDAIAPALEKLFKGEWKSGIIPNLWDGNAAARIVKELLKLKSEILIYQT